MMSTETPALRFAMWTSHTIRGDSERASYSGRSEAVENAGKYWLTPVGLNRVFVCDSENYDTIVFERHYEAPKQRVRKPRQAP